MNEAAIALTDLISKASNLVYLNIARVDFVDEEKARALIRALKDTNSKHSLEHLDWSYDA